MPMKLRTFKNQRGFLSVISILILLVVSIVVVLLTDMFSSSIKATESISESNGAFYLAVSGLNAAKRDLFEYQRGVTAALIVNNDEQKRILEERCKFINDRYNRDQGRELTYNLGTIATGTGPTRTIRGRYRVTCHANSFQIKTRAGLPNSVAVDEILIENPFETVNSVAGNIEPNALTINLATPIISSLLDDTDPRPRIIRIDNEIIGFTSIVGNQLRGLTRGMMGTTPAKHAGGTTIFQGLLDTGTINKTYRKIDTTGAIYDTEAISYHGIETVTNAATSLTVSRLLNTKRGALNSAPAITSHAAGELFAQDVLILTAEAGVPDLTQRIGSRTIYEVLTINPKNVSVPILTNGTPATPATESETVEPGTDPVFSEIEFYKKLIGYVPKTDSKRVIIDIIAGSGKIKPQIYTDSRLIYKDSRIPSEKIVCSNTDTLRAALKAGVTAATAKKKSCKAGDLKAAGYTEYKLKEAGFTQKEINDKKTTQRKEEDKENYTKVWASYHAQGKVIESEMKPKNIKEESYKTVDPYESELPWLYYKKWDHTGTKNSKGNYKNGDKSAMYRIIEWHFHNHFFGKTNSATPSEKDLQKDLDNILEMKRESETDDDTGLKKGFIDVHIEDNSKNPEELIFDTLKFDEDPPALPKGLVDPGPVPTCEEVATWNLPLWTYNCKDEQKKHEKKQTVYKKQLADFKNTDKYIEYAERLKKKQMGTTDDKTGKVITKGIGSKIIKISVPKIKEMTGREEREHWYSGLGEAIYEYRKYKTIEFRNKWTKQPTFETQLSPAILIIDGDLKIGGFAKNFLNNPVRLDYTLGTEDYPIQVIINGNLEIEQTYGSLTVHGNVFLTGGLKIIQSNMEKELKQGFADWSIKEVSKGVFNWSKRAARATSGATIGWVADKFRRNPTIDETKNGLDIKSGRLLTLENVIYENRSASITAIIEEEGEVIGQKEVTVDTTTPEGVYEDAERGGEETKPAEGSQTTIDTDPGQAAIDGALIDGRYKMNISELILVEEIFR